MNWETGQSIFTVCMMSLAAWAVGAPVVRRLRISSIERWEETLWAAAVGSLLWGMGLALLGLVGLLYVPLIGLLTWTACLAGLYQCFPASKRIFPSWGTDDLSGSEQSPLVRRDTSGEQSEFSEASELGRQWPEDRPSLPGPTGPWMSEANPDWEPVFEEPGWSPFGPPPSHASSVRRVDLPGSPVSSSWVSGRRRESTFPPNPPSWLVYGIGSLAAGGVLAALVVALAPPTAGDALRYHLELPKRFLQGHTLAYLPYDDNCTHPLLTEMWFLWALALDSEVAAQLVHWMWGVLFGLAAVHFSRLFLAREWAWLAGAVVLLVPGVLNQMTVPLNDVALAAMTALALAAWWQACAQKEPACPQKERTSPQQDRAWFLLAGLALGGSASIQYSAFLLTPCLAGLWGWKLWQQANRRRSLLSGAALAGIAAFAVAGLWYGRAAWYHGNPVFPRAQADWPIRVSPPQAETLPQEKSPWPGRSLGWLAAPWSVTMQPERFGGREHELGALWLAVLPGLLWAERRRDLETLLWLAGGYFVLWFLVRPNVRGLLPILPMLAPLVVWVWAEMPRLPQWPRVLAGLAMAVCLLIPVGWLGLRMRDHLPAALGAETRQEFLYRKEPSYPAAMLVNLLLVPEAKILSQDDRTFYFDAPVVRESVYRRRTRYDHQVHRPGDLTRWLRQEGFTHLLLVENLSKEAVPFDPTLARLAEAELALPQSPLQELSEYRTTAPDGSMRRYRLLTLR